MQLPEMNKRKILSHAASVVNKQKQTEDSFFLSYPILCPCSRLFCLELNSLELVSLEPPGLELGSLEL